MQEQLLLCIESKSLYTEKDEVDLAIMNSYTHEQGNFKMFAFFVPVSVSDLFNKQLIIVYWNSCTEKTNGLLPDLSKNHLILGCDD